MPEKPEPEPPKAASNPTAGVDLPDGAPEAGAGDGLTPSRERMQAIMEGPPNKAALTKCCLDFRSAFNRVPRRRCWDSCLFPPCRSRQKFGTANCLHPMPWSIMNEFSQDVRPDIEDGGETADRPDREHQSRATLCQPRYQARPLPWFWPECSRIVRGSMAGPRTSAICSGAMPRRSGIIGCESVRRQRAVKAKKA